MAKGPATGYVFAIHDPRLTLKKEPDIIYVGNSYTPWITIQRHFRRSNNSELAKWAESIHKDFPEGVEILGQVVLDRWHGDDLPLPEPTPGITRIEWEVLGLEKEVDYVSTDRGAQRIFIGTLKNHHIERLRAAGHPLLNKSAGRPRKEEKI